MAGEADSVQRARLSSGKTCVSPINQQQAAFAGGLFDFLFEQMKTLQMVAESCLLQNFDLSWPDQVKVGKRARIARELGRFPLL